MFNRSFELNDFTIRFLSFEMFLTGDLAFLMTLLGQHNQSHVKCLLCDLQNSNKSNQNLAWQSQESKGNLWTIESLVDAGKDVLLKGIPMTNVVAPVLHVPMGIWIYLLNVLLLYIRDKIEKDTHEVASKKGLLNSKTVSVNEAPDHLTDLENKLRSARRTITKTHEAQVAKDKSIHHLSSQIEAKIKDIRALKKEVQALNKEISKLKVERKNRPIEQQLEEVLHSNSISFTTWTTLFSLTGDNCRRFAEHHEKIFKEVIVIINANVPSEINTTPAIENFKKSVFIMFEKLSILASVFDSICVVMNDITAQDSDTIEQFGFMCKLFGSIWRKCKLNVTPKVHMVESHLPDMLHRHGRLGIFNENPIERQHIYNKRWEKVLSNLKMGGRSFFEE